MGLNLSGLQIARELEVGKSNVRDMHTTLRQGVVDRIPPETHSGEVECNEVEVVAGHKGHPEVVKKGRVGRRRRLRGVPGRGALEMDKPPSLGMLRRGGWVVIRILWNVHQTTRRPLIAATIAAAMLVLTDEDDIHRLLEERGYRHKTVCHEKGECAHDEEGDGLDEVHVNTIEGCWSLLRSRLRPLCGIPLESLPPCLAYFQFVRTSDHAARPCWAPSSLSL